MKKFITVGILLILASISLNGCVTPPAEEPMTTPADEQPATVQEEPTEEPAESTEILSYSTDDVPVEVSKETMPFDYTVENFESLAMECGTTHEDGYLEDLVEKFEDAEKTVYTFAYTEESQAPDSYVVTLLPNVMEYKDLDEFKKDFEQCFAGGDAYPKMLNEDWLVLQSSCGTGFNDGSGNPIGCAEIKDVVEPSLKLNETSIATDEEEPASAE